MGSSVFADLAASAREAHADLFGNSEEVVVTLTVGSDAPVPVQAVLHKQRTVTREVDGDKRRVTVRQCRFPTLTTIHHTAIVTIGDQRWAIDEVGDCQASGLNVQLKQEVFHQRSRSGYRGASSNVSSNSKAGG